MADRLSAEIAMARAAGMSYGKWKMLHPEFEYIEEKPIVTEKLHPCKRCGNPVPRTIGSKKDQYCQKLYCSNSCKIEAYYERTGKKRYKERQEKENRKPGKCLWCNKQIPAVNDNGRKVRYDRKYCSNTCRQTYLYYQKKDGAADA